MIGTSFGEWVLIRLSIVFFRYTPACYCLVVLASLPFAGNTTSGFAACTSAAGLLLAEGVFYALVYRPYQNRLTEHATHPDPPTREERKAIFYRCLENVESVETYMRGWFLGADLEDIRRNNVREFLLWAFFDREDDEAAERDAILVEDVEEFVGLIEDRLGRRLEQGRSPIKSLRLTLDGIETTYRSLLWYIMVFAVDQFTHLLLVKKGFRYYAATEEHIFPPRPQRHLSRHRSPAPTLGYWYSPHRSADKLPLVFFHGIGIGLLVYIEYLGALLTTKNGLDGGVGVIALELPPISFRLTSPPATKAEFLEQMTCILDHHGWDSIALASHSYGSVLVAHMLSSPALQKRVLSLVVIDPVSILLHLPDVAYNFTRRRPQRANEWQLWYFASTDPGVAHCLGRHFFWRDNIVWRDELLGPAHASLGGVGRRVAVCLSGRDLITNPGAIAQYLEGPDDGGEEVKVIVFPTLDHAQVFDAPAERQQVVDLTRSYCERPVTTL